MSIEGVITIVQDSRFQLTDDRGVSHLFVLGHRALAEPAELERLVQRQARVRVKCGTVPGLIGFVAHSLATL